MRSRVVKGASRRSSVRGWARRSCGAPLLATIFPSSRNPCPAHLCFGRPFLTPPALCPWAAPALTLRSRGRPKSCAFCPPLTSNVRRHNTRLVPPSMSPVVSFGMNAAAKLLASMRRNPLDWQIGDLQAVARQNNLDWRHQRSSHCVFIREDGRTLSVPAHRPIKPIYVRKFVDLIDGA
jgi:hypothetical protein